nr:MAG TPA: hypothetical protein [Caudoviricetes sp.]
MYWLIFPMISVVLSHQLILWVLSIFECIDSHLILFLVTYISSYLEINITFFDLYCETLKSDI